MWRRREVAAFVVSAVFALTLVSAGTVWLSERIAHRNALEGAELSGARLAENLVAPDLRAALAGMPGRLAALDRAVTNRMSDGSVTRVVVWGPDGRPLYANTTAPTDGPLVPPPELARALSGETVSDVDHRPNTVDDGTDATRVLEIFTPLDAGNGETVAVQTWFTYDGINQQAALVRREIIPLAIGALVALELVQLPILVSLSRRVRLQETERAQLMARTVEASDRERRAIAADVHDGPVQDLAGISYALTALRTSVPEERQPTVDRLVGAVRNAVQSLRRLMIDIYPPDLSGAGLAAAVSDCAEPLRTQGLKVLVDAVPVEEMSSDAAASLYRTAKEALANVATHSQAGQAWVTLERIEHKGAPAVRLEIADDGVGFPDSGTDRRTEGHLGLKLVRDRIEDLGGTLELGPRLGGGAVLTAVVPTEPRS